MAKSRTAKKLRPRQTELVQEYYIDDLYVYATFMDRGHLFRVLENRPYFAISVVRGKLMYQYT